MLLERMVFAVRPLPEALAHLGTIETIAALGMLAFGLAGLVGIQILLYGAPKSSIQKVEVSPPVKQIFFR